MRFHEAALWGAITFVRHFTKNQTTGKEIMEAFQDYFGLDEDSFPTDCAWVIYGRTSEKIRLSRKGELPKEPKLFKSEIVNEVRQMRKTIDEWLKNNDNGSK